MTEGFLIGCLVALVLGIIAVLVGSEIYIARIRCQGEKNMAPYKGILRDKSIEELLDKIDGALGTIIEMQASYDELRVLFENAPEEYWRG